MSITDAASFLTDEFNSVKTSNGRLLQYGDGETFLSRCDTPDTPAPELMPALLCHGGLHVIHAIMCV